MSQGRKIANFTILQKLGEGARSTLWAVHDPKTRQVWTLKNVELGDDKDDRFFQQMQQEYDVGSKLDHFNVRKVERLIKHRKMLKTHSMSMLMELIDGEPLDVRLPKNHVQAVKIFQEVAAGIDHMHGRGFVHADMKPSNVLLTDTGEVKIIDLGQACPIGTIKKRIQGTPGYMAPEQAHRQAITPQTDIYNLGAMMYWVLVGQVIPTVLPPKGGDSGNLYSGAIDACQVEPPGPPPDRNPPHPPPPPPPGLDHRKHRP